MSDIIDLYTQLRQSMRSFKGRREQAIADKAVLEAAEKITGGRLTSTVDYEEYLPMIAQVSQREVDDCRTVIQRFKRWCGGGLRLGDTGPRRDS